MRCRIKQIEGRQRTADNGQRHTITIKQRANSQKQLMQSTAVIRFINKPATAATATTATITETTSTTKTQIYAINIQS